MTQEPSVFLYHGVDCSAAPPVAVWVLSVFFAREDPRLERRRRARQRAAPGAGRTGPGPRAAVRVLGRGQDLARQSQQVPRAEVVHPALGEQAGEGVGKTLPDRYGPSSGEAVAKAEAA